MGAEQAILRCLEKNPEDRFVAVEEFAARFSRAILDSSRDVQAFSDPDADDASKAVPDHVREHAVGHAVTTKSFRGGSLGGKDAADPSGGQAPPRSPITTFPRGRGPGDD